MTQDTDIYIKDEGEFVTIILQSENARKAAKESQINEDTFDIHTSDTLTITKWCITHNLSLYSEVPLNIKQKEK